MGVWINHTDTRYFVNLYKLSGVSIYNIFKDFFDRPIIKEIITNVDEPKLGLSTEYLDREPLTITALTRYLSSLDTGKRFFTLEMSKVIMTNSGATQIDKDYSTNYGFTLEVDELSPHQFLNTFAKPLIRTVYQYFLLIEELVYDNKDVFFKRVMDTNDYPVAYNRDAKNILLSGNYKYYWADISYLQLIHFRNKNNEELYNERLFIELENLLELLVDAGVDFLYHLDLPWSYNHGFLYIQPMKRVVFVNDANQIIARYYNCYYPIHLMDHVAEKNGCVYNIRV